MRGYDRLGRGGLLAGLGHNSASVAEAFSFQAATSQTPHIAPRLSSEVAANPVLRALHEDRGLLPV
jgi:hypothetical protein